MPFNQSTLANLKPFKSGESGNPSGRPTAGSTIREWINSLVDNELTESQLREVARDTSFSAAKRIAAERILKSLESGDLADYDAWLDGSKTLKELRASGVNTAVIRKARITDKGGREIELHDRAGAEVDRIIGHTELTVLDTEKFNRLDAGKRIGDFEVIITTPLTRTDVKQ